MVFGLDHHQRAGLAEDEAVPIPVEWPTRTGRVVVGGGQHDSHLGEPSDRHGLNSCLDAAADRHVGLAEHDVAPRMGNGFGARGACRDHGRDPSLCAALQTDRGGSGVRHELLHRQRGHAPQALRSHAVIGKEQFLARAHAGADRDHQPPGVDLRRPGVLPEPPAQHCGHLLQVGQPAQLDLRQQVVEILEEMPPDANR